MQTNFFSNIITDWQHHTFSTTGSDHSTSFLDDLADWKKTAIGTHVSVAAARYRDAYNDGAHALILDDLDDLETLPPSFPPSVKILTLINCKRLKIVPPLPSGLQHLDLTGCREITDLPPKPLGLKTLHLTGCPGIKVMPKSYRDLRSEDVQLDGFMEPDGIITRLTMCTSLTSFSLTSLPPLLHLPQSVQTSNLRCCTQLTSLPQNLQILDLGSWASFHPFTSPSPTLPPFEAWYHRAGKTEEEIEQVKQAVQSIKTTKFFSAFETLLKRLNEHQLKNRVIPSQVVDVIDEVIQYSDIRDVIFDAAQEADQNCHDRPLLIFNTIQALAYGNALQRGHDPERKILTLAQAMVKLTLLDEAVPKIMTQQWQEGRRVGNNIKDHTGQIANNGRGTGPNTTEALEVQLALREQLRIDLQLPFPVQGLYTSINVTALNNSDLKFATNYVNKAMDDKNRLVDNLVRQPVWVTYLTPLFKDEIDSIKKEYEWQMLVLDNKLKKAQLSEEEYLQHLQSLQQDGTINEEQYKQQINMLPFSERLYLQQIKQLSENRENDIQESLKQKIEEILDRYK